MTKVNRVGAWLATAFLIPLTAAAEDSTKLDVESLARDVLGQAGYARQEALAALEQRGNPDVAPTLIQAFVSFAAMRPRLIRRYKHLPAKTSLSGTIGCSGRKVTRRSSHTRGSTRSKPM